MRSEAGPHVSAAAAVVPKPRRGTVQKVCVTIPLFAYLLLIYIAIELLVPNVRAVIYTWQNYSITWVEIIHFLATVMAMAELLRVSRPGIDNTREAMFMLGIGVLYFALFLVGATGVRWLRIFNNTEFLFIMLISWTQIVLAFMINARTLKRTIDYTSSDHG